MQCPSQDLKEGSILRTAVQCICTDSSQGFSPPALRCRETTLLSTEVNSNMAALIRGLVGIPTKPSVASHLWQLWRRIVSSPYPEPWRQAPPDPTGNAQPPAPALAPSPKTPTHQNPALWNRRIFKVKPVLANVEHSKQTQQDQLAIQNRSIWMNCFTELCSNIQRAKDTPSGKLQN